MCFRTYVRTCLFSLAALLLIRHSAWLARFGILYRRRRLRTYARTVRTYVRTYVDRFVERLSAPYNPATSSTPRVCRHHRPTPSSHLPTPRVCSHHRPTLSSNLPTTCVCRLCLVASYLKRDQCETVLGDFALSCRLCRLSRFVLCRACRPCRRDLCVSLGVSATSGIYCGATVPLVPPWFVPLVPLVPPWFMQTAPLVSPWFVRALLWVTYVRTYVRT